MNKKNEIAALFLSYLFTCLFGGATVVAWTFESELGRLVVVITIISAAAGIFFLSKIWRKALRNELMIRKKVFERKER